MSRTQAVAVYALEIPPGDVIVEAAPGIPHSSFRITMAAIDPSAVPMLSHGTNGDAPVRATLKLLRPDPEDEDDDEDSYLEALLAGNGSDVEDESEESSDDEEINGGPSDPSKSKKARKEAAIAKIRKALEEDEDSLEDLEASGLNGTSSKLKKGKGKAVATVDESDSEDEDDEDTELEKYVLCTLDPEKTYQQPLDIFVNGGERILFQVSGTHTIYLTGNYVDDLPAERYNLDDSDDEEDGDYDLSPDEDELDESDESDELDDVEEPVSSIMEIGSDEEFDPATLVKVTGSKLNGSKESTKGKNKRSAEDSDENDLTLDQLLAKSMKPDTAAINGEKKLSKKQQKKLKNNAGQAVEAVQEPSVTKAPSSDSSTTTKSDKKVQFAKNLEQGPTNSQKPTKPEAKASTAADTKADDSKSKPSLGIKMVQGVQIDDKKLGSGRVAKNGDRVSLRYIGKLENGKVFDANKKGKPFSFKVGSEEVIKGMDIGVVGMSVGGERRINIPAPLAYGNDAKPQIPAHSNLCFDLKILDITKR